jgi:DNA-binding transcriptional LysR family regulator
MARTANPISGHRLTRALYSPSLVYFAAIAESGSVRGASQKLNVAASAVNRQLLQLESSLGVQLFDRVGRGLRIAAAGEALRRHCAVLTRDLDETISEIQDMQGLRTGHVRIAAVESFAASILPGIVASFSAAFPLLQVSVSVAPTVNVQEIVALDEADVGFAFNPLRAHRFNIEMQHDLAIGAVVRAGHPLARRKAVTLAQCLAWPTVLPMHGLSLREALDPLLARDAERTRHTIETTSLRFMTALVRSGDFVAFQTRLGIIPLLSRGELAFLSLREEGLRRDRFAAITNARTKLRLAPAAFLDHCRREVERHLAEHE